MGDRADLRRDRDRDRGREPSLAWLGAAADSLRTLAGIWATVDLERAQADLGRSKTGGAAPWAGPRPELDGAVVEDPLLGARVAVVPTADDGGWIALAEPSTEGRLAATLARHGEGAAGRYVLSPVGLEAIRVLAAKAGVSVSRAASGPFGPSLLVVNSVAGPHLILVDPGRSPADRAAVPSPP